MATAFLAVKNNAVTEVAAPVGAGDGTITVQSAGVFPAAFPYDLSVGSEIVRVTAAAGDVLTVTRGVQGTAAGAHDVGDLIGLRVTAQSVSDLNAAVNTIEDKFDVGQAKFSGIGGASVSTGGTVLVQPDAGTGAGLVVYSNRGADAAGRLLVVNQANAANPQQAVRIQNEGTGHTVSISHNPAGGAGDASAEAVDIVSTNPLDTAVGIQGQEEGKGTLKVSHVKPTNPDGNASVLSLRANGLGTAAQGIFFDAEDGGTTGKLMNFRQAGVEKFVVESDGTVRSFQHVGGAAATDELTLAPNSNASKGDAQIVLDFTRLDGAGAGEVRDAVDMQIPTDLDGIITGALAIGRSQTITPTAVSHGIRAVQVLGTWVHTLAHGGVPYLVFALSSTVQLQGAGGGGSSTVNLGDIVAFQAGAVVELTSENTFGTIDTGQTRQFADTTVYRRGAGITTATATVAQYDSFRVAGSVDAGITVTNKRGLRIIAPGGSGTIGTLVGVDVEDLAAYAGTLTFTPLSLRSTGDTVQLRHDGPGVFGESASGSGPTNTSVGLEVRSTTKAFLLPRMTAAQAGALTAVDGMLVYVTTTDTTFLVVGAHQRVNNAWQAI